MNAEQFARAKALFLEVADLDLARRARHLAGHANDDAEIRAEVEAWLEADAGSAAAETHGPAVLSIPSGVLDAWNAGDGGDPVLSPGSRLAGRYRIDAFIDRGGMGEVYRATDEELATPVAVKIVRREVAENPAALGRLKREVLSARSVTHPGVCRIYDFGRDEERDLSFLTMEYLPGETLSARLLGRGPLDRPAAESLFRQLADALDAAHAAGIVHRDLKSANVMVVSSPQGERAVITDFGLALPPTPNEPRDSGPAAERSPAHAAEPTAGTPAYMSPEQVTGRALGPASDLYALGVLLYETLTGRLPFEGETPSAVARARLTQTPLAPSTVRAIDAAWDPVILALLDRDPGKRFPSAGAAVRALECEPHAADEPHHALPPEHDVFVGREAELRELCERLEPRGSFPSSPESDALTRALTLIGPPGVGKTRLATRYARQSLNRWPGGVWWCDLSTSRDLTDVLAAVARALGVPIVGTDPAAQIAGAIDARGRCLVILDNVEQVVAEVRSPIESWLDEAPEASFLMTSRQRLPLRITSTMELEPLDVGTAGVALFTARARVAQPGFRIDDTARPHVVDVVEMLDGLPLAIELAASRVRVLGIEQLRDRLRDRFGLLVGGEGGRHATLETALDWSWDLLTPAERAAAAQASVFEGGFTLEAAESVIDLSAELGPNAVLDVLQSLVDKSWLRVRVAHGTPRFEMYVSIHAYARRALEAGVAPGDTACAGGARYRHSKTYAALDTDETYRAFDRAGGLERLSLDVGNYIGACRASIARKDFKTAIGAMSLAQAVLRRIGPIELGIDLAEAVLGIPRPDPADLARAHRSLGKALRLAGRLDEARRHGKAALDAYRTLGDRGEEAKVLSDLGAVAGGMSDPALSRRLQTDALDAYRDSGNLEGESYALHGLAWACWALGLVPETRAHFESALDIARQVGNQRIEGTSRYGLGVLSFFDGRHEEARRHYESAVTALEAVWDDNVLAITLHALGSLHHQAGRASLADRYYRQSLGLHRRLGARRAEARDLASLGCLHGTQGRLEEAEDTLERALAIAKRTASHQEQGLARAYLGLVEKSRDRFASARDHYGAALAIFREFGPINMVAYALAAMADVHREEDHLSEARSCLDEALAVSRESGTRVVEGPILVSLGAVDLKAERLDDARARIEEGIELMRKSETNAHLLGGGLCRLGELECLEGDVARARDALSQADALARELGVMPRSELAKAVTRLGELLASSASET